MPNTLTKQAILSLLPPGSLWIPYEDEDFDKLLDGIADNAQIIFGEMSLIAFIRDPQKTSIISDLEKEFGLAFDSSLTDQERRDRVLAAKTANKGDGTDTFMQAKLQESGFNLLVHQNNPPVDPQPILDDGFKVFLDDQNFFLGNENALLGQQSGSLVVNGISTFEEKYSSPASSDYWHLVFFVGGVATRDGVTNEILSIEVAQVPVSRSSELIRLIVKYKPLHSWCGLVVEFV